MAERLTPDDATREDLRREIARLRDDLTRAEQARDQAERERAPLERERDRLQRERGLRPPGASRPAPTGRRDP